MINEILENTLQLPSYEKIPVTGQLDIVVMERRQLPLVSFRLEIWGGSSRDPEGREGLVRLTAKLLQKGSGTYSARKFASLVEGMGAAVSVQTGFDSVTINGGFLSKDVDKGLDIIAQMIQEPRFSEREISFVKKKTISEIQSTLDDPGRLCSVLHKKNLYQNHPYAQPVRGYQHSIKKIHKNDIIETHQKKILKSRMLLTIVGDVKAEDIISRAAELFAGLTAKVPMTKNNTSPSAINGRTIFIIHKGDQTQAHIRIGNIGIARIDPAFHRLVVTNNLFGGSFTSRLMTEIRVNRGLTYGIRSAVSAYKEPGSITITTFTKTATTALVVDLIFEEIHSLRTAKVSQKELDGTKRYLIGLYPLSLEKNNRLANQLSNLYFYGLSPKEIVEYPGKIAGVSVDEVHKTAEKYYSESNSIVTLLGDSDKLVPQMEKFGTVVRKNIEDYSLTHSKK